jgi:beta-mannosidase
LDLMAAGIIADPHTRLHELGCQWVDEATWIYRTRFEWSGGGPRQVLRFGGLDTIAEVFLNGKLLAKSDNMFVPLEVEVTGLLLASNELEVRFSSAAAVGRERRAAYLASEGIPESVKNFDERAFVRKAQYMFGWDWGPRLVSCGIWQPVELLEFSSRILDVHTTQHWNEDGSVELQVTVESEGDGDVTVSFDGEDGVMDLGEGRYRIESPNLWEAGSYPGSYIFMTVCDGYSNSHLVGLRRIELVREPDQFGESFEFRLNGKPIWIRGANWIPDHSFPALVSKATYRERLEQAAQMGINMLRVWGGGLYETEDFYDLCDEKGILVWQDFPFACSYYPEDKEFQRSVAQEALVNIRRLRNHPCLALWCGNNENHTMWHEKWLGAEFAPPRHYGLELYGNLIPGILVQEDPGTPYIEGSPIFGTKEGPDANPNAGGSGDQHYWAVWHGRGDWIHYADSTARFSSEFGFASAPQVETWERAEVPLSCGIGSGPVRWHEKTSKTWQSILDLVCLHYPEPKNLEDWIYYSQLNQRDAMRFAIEHYRWSKFCKGTLIWQLNDCWPVQSWSLIDSCGNLKAAGYEMRRVYADVLFSIQRTRHGFSPVVRNNGDEPIDLYSYLAIWNLRTGELIREIAPDGKRWYGGKPTGKPLLPGERRRTLDCSIRDFDPSEILITAGDHDEVWRLGAEPKDMKLFPAKPITVSTANDDLEILTEGPVVDLMLTENGSTRPFVTNFFTQGTGGVISACINRPVKEVEARSLAGKHDVRMVRGPLF